MKRQQLAQIIAGQLVEREQLPAYMKPRISFHVATASAVFESEYGNFRRSFLDIHYDPFDGRVVRYRREYP